jgi:hypothetical protein
VSTPSLVTSIIGGIQGASAAHDAAAAIQKGYGQAGQTVTQAAQQVNPDILTTAQQAGQGVTQAAATGAQGATTAAATGGTAATTAAQAGGTAATTAAGQLSTMLNPYISGGSAAMNQLSADLAPGGSLTTPFTASMMAQYSPAYQFQLQQGTQAAQRAAAAAGVTGSGGTAKALQRYTQDYANTAFSSAANLYNQQQQAIYGRLSGVAGMGQTAATTAGTAGIGAAEYAGTLGENAAQYAGTLGENAAQYAGTLGTGAAQYAGTANINARDLASQNTLSAANYLANTQVGAQQAIAQGDLGAASQWNNMLGGIGSAANSVAMMGFGAPVGAGGGAGGGWSLSNIGPNFSNMMRPVSPYPNYGGGYQSQSPAGAQGINTNW